jgi:thioredoxin 1
VAHEIEEPHLGTKVIAETVKEPSVKQLIEKDYDAQVLASVKPVVLDFYSEGSVPCEAFAPRMGAVAEKFEEQIQFFKILRNQNETLAKTLNVTASPTLLFFKNGKELGERLTGDDIKRTALKASVEALLKA